MDLGISSKQVKDLAAAITEKTGLQARYSDKGDVGSGGKVILVIPGADQEQTTRIIDEVLVPARNKAGFSKDDLSFTEATNGVHGLFKKDFKENEIGISYNPDTIDRVVEALGKAKEEIKSDIEKIVPAAAGKSQTEATTKSKEASNAEQKDAGSVAAAAKAAFGGLLGKVEDDGKSPGSVLSTPQLPSDRSMSSSKQELG